MAIICDECKKDIHERHDGRVFCTICFGKAVSTGRGLHYMLAQFQGKYSKLEKDFYKLVKKANALQVKLNNIKNKRKIRGNKWE